MVLEAVLAEQELVERMRNDSDRRSFGTAAAVGIVVLDNVDDVGVAADAPKAASCGILVMQSLGERRRNDTGVVGFDTDLDMVLRSICVIHTLIFSLQIRILRKNRFKFKQTKNRNRCSNVMM